MQTKLQDILAYLLRPLKPLPSAGVILLAVVLSALWLWKSAHEVPHAEIESVANSNEPITPAAPVVAAKAANKQHILEVKRGDTLSSVLARFNAKNELANKSINRQADDVTNSKLIQYLNASKEMRPSLSHLRSGQRLVMETSAEGKFASLTLPDGFDTLWVVQPGGVGGLTHSLKKLVVKKTIHTVFAVVENSLFESLDVVGAPETLAASMVNIFGSAVDFNNDLRSGDTFSITYEQTQVEGNDNSRNFIIAVQLHLANGTHEAYWYPRGNHADGGGYYDAKGNSLQRDFLRSPVAFTRITSRFTKRRFHPVLRTWRAHRGVDFAAPAGTPVHASGNGTVSFFGRQGGYGNLIILQHKNQFNSYYGHLSRFARGLHRGQKVKQGQLIGFVGSTGMATGPHLHYEIRERGKYRNPMTLVTPPARSIAKSERAAFDAYVNEQRSKLEGAAPKSLPST